MPLMRRFQSEVMNEKSQSEMGDNRYSWVVNTSEHQDPLSVKLLADLNQTLQDRFDERVAYARARDAKLIQYLLNALERLVYLEFLNEEGISSGAPTSKDWKLAFDKAQESIDMAYTQGFKPTE
jgi:hypothetical protein